MQKLDRQVWAAKDTYLIGELYQGLRSSDAGFASALAQALRSYHQPEVEAPANFSARLPSSGPPLATLYRGYQAVLRTGDLRRFTRGLLTHLRAVAQIPRGLVLRMSAVLSERGAVLTPSRISIVPHLLSRSLLAEGYIVVDAPWIELDPLTWRLTIPSPALQIDLDPLEGWLGGPLAPDPGGTHEVIGLVLESGPNLPSLLQVVAHLLGRTKGLEPDAAGETVEQLIVGLEDRPLHSVSDQRELVAAVQSVLR